MNKTLEQWSMVDAKLCASQNSVAANQYLISDAKSDIDQLGKMVAERDALLREVSETLWQEDDSGDLFERIDAALSATAEPAGPARCMNCDRATVEQCDDAGCGFLGAGNGEPAAVRQKSEEGAMSKLERRKQRIETDRRKELERAAFFSSQPKGSDSPIRIADIPYTKFEG